jgi:folate-dependent phosphoribosylglycinamide formyltransferase PurN
MRVTIFTSNQPRHLNLAKELSKLFDHVYMISEVNTVFPGQVDDFFRKSDVMQAYFEKVIDSEKKIFGEIGFLPENVRSLSIKLGDLSKLERQQLDEALASDVYVVFGASYIRGWLIDFLVENRALNIHMGLSPYYRGSSCNFWALYDGRPGYVGATIHYLSQGLDSGDILFHCTPELLTSDSPFDFAMRSVLVAQQALASSLQNGSIFSFPNLKQDRLQEIRYSKNQDFTDEIAREFLSREIDLNPENLTPPSLLKGRESADN